MTIRLPEDEKLITGRHAEEAIQHALSLHQMFTNYIRETNGEMPSERLKDQQERYAAARKQAVDLSRSQGYLIGAASRLP